VPRSPERYLAYGLRIESELPLLELPRSRARGTDVVIRLRKAGDPSPEHSPPANARRSASVVYEASIPGVGVFAVLDGREIAVDPAPRADPRILRVYLLGSILGVLLHQRGLFVLHANCVSIGGVAVAIAGESGAGKSSIAAALHSRGHEVIADDVTAVRVDGDRVDAVPGYPGIKLWPDAINALGFTVDELPVVRPDFTKRWLHVSTGFPRLSVPLARVYVLAVGERAELSALDRRQALWQLIQHSYFHFLDYREGAGTQLSQTVALAARLHVMRLASTRDSSTIPALARLIETDTGAASPRRCRSGGRRPTPSRT